MSLKHYYNAPFLARKGAASSQISDAILGLAGRLICDRLGPSAPSMHAMALNENTRPQAR